MNAPTGSSRVQGDDALALIDDLFATFLIPHDDADPMHAGWTRGASVRADVAQGWRDRRAALVARTPQPAERAPLDVSGPLIVGAAGVPIDAYDAIDLLASRNGDFPARLLASRARTVADLWNDPPNAWQKVAATSDFPELADALDQLLDGGPGDLTDVRPAVPAPLPAVPDGEDETTPPRRVKADAWGPIPELPLADPNDTGHGYVVARVLDGTGLHGDRVLELWDDDMHRAESPAAVHHLAEQVDDDGGWCVYEVRRLDAEDAPCGSCGHDADHSGGECMWIEDVQTPEGGSYQVGCRCDGSPNPDTDPDDPLGEHVPARFDAAADAIDEHNPYSCAGGNLRSIATSLRLSSPEVRAAVAAALARPTERER